VISASERAIRFGVCVICIGLVGCSSPPPSGTPAAVQTSAVPAAEVVFGGESATDVPGDVVFGEDPADPVVADPVVADPVVADPVVADPVVADPVVADPVVANPAPTSPPVTSPPTTQDISQWTIPVRTTLPYVIAASAQLPIAGSLVINGLSIPVPANWLALQSQDDAAAATQLNEQVRSSVSATFATDPFRAYFVPADEQVLPQATTVLAIVRPQSAIGSEDALRRLIERSRQNDGLRIVSKGRSDWLGGKAWGAVLRSPDGRTRCIRVVRLTDLRLVILQADGVRSDMESLHAQFGDLMAESAEPFA
jgi:hypothetical protein